MKRLKRIGSVVLLLGLTATSGGLFLSRLLHAENSAAASRDSKKSEQAVVSKSDYDKEILPLLEYYCFDCHGEGAKKGDFVLDEHGNFDLLAKDFEHWKAIFRNVDRKIMPPAKAEDKPSEEEREKIVQWIGNHPS